MVEIFLKVEPLHRAAAGLLRPAHLRHLGLRADGGRRGTPIRAYHMPIGTYALRTGYRGNVNGCYRSFTMSVEQLVRRFGLENCSPTVQDHFRSQALRCEHQGAPR